MRKWLVPLGVTCAVVIVGVAICLIADSRANTYTYNRELPPKKWTAS